MGTRENFRKKGSKIWESSRYAGVGLEFGICVVACHYIGSKVDDYWGTGNVGSLVGIIVGFCAGLLSLVKIAQRESKHKSPQPEECQEKEITEE